MKIISFFNIKGGVGKTTSAINVAYILSSKYRKKVLLIDIDPQANSSFFFNIQDTERSIADILKDDVNITDSITKTEYPRLDIIPAGNELWGFERKLLMSDGTQQYRLRDALKTINDKYDYVIIDCTNMVGSLLILNAFAASDYVFVPVRDEAWATMGLISTIQFIDEMTEYNAKLKFGGCFYSSWENRKVNIESFNALKESFGDGVIDIKIRKTKSIPEMSYQHEPLPVYDKKGTATEDYFALTKEIIKRTGG